MSISEIKKDAKAFLKEDNYWKTLGLSGLYLVTVMIIGFITGVISEVVPYIGNIVSFAISAVIAVPISFGYIKTLVKMKKGEKVNILNFFTEGFNSFNRAISAWWSTFWRKLLKTIPGKILMIFGMLLLFIYFIYWIITTAAFIESFQMGLQEALGDNYYEVISTWYGIIENISPYASVFEALKLLGGIIIVLGWLATLPFVLEYVIYEIVAVDREDLDAAQIAKKSQELMKGNRLKYIGFLFSFIGWDILCVLSCGIGFIFLMPYMQVAKISFYESLKNENPNVIEQEIIEND